MTLIPKAELLERLRALKYPPNYGGKEQRTANYYLDKAIAIVEGMGEQSVPWRQTQGSPETADNFDEKGPKP